MDSTTESTPDNQTTTTTTTTTTATATESPPTSNTSTTASIGSLADSSAAAAQSIPSESSSSSSPTASYSSSTYSEENTNLNAPTLPSSSSSSSSAAAAAATDSATATATATADTVLDESSSTDPSTSTEGSTTIEVYWIEGGYPCPKINDTYAVVNTSDVREGTVVSVTCRSPAKLVTLPKNQDVFICNGGYWRPHFPSCRLDAESPAPVGIIVGCTLGGLVCLVLVAAAIFLMWRSMKERKIHEERNQEFNEKMDIICLYVNSKFEDAVGMPVMTLDARDSGLRGRQTTSDQSSTPDHHLSHQHEYEAGKLDADLF